MGTPVFEDLKGKVVVITGAGGVLGSEIARAFAAQGARLALLDIDKELANAVAEKIRASGGEVIAVKADVLDMASLEMARAAVSDAFGPCEVLINGAGGNHPKGITSKTRLFPEDLEATEELTTFFSLDPQGIRFVFDLNFMGSFLPSQVFGKEMVGKKGCSILNISSMNAFRPLSKIPAYSGAKAAISNFTQWLAVHFAPVGIRVNALAPGFFLTEQNRDLLITAEGNITERGKAILDHTPAGRYGNPEDLVGTALWLTSNLADFITGTIIPIDGGFSAFSGV